MHPPAQRVILLYLALPCKIVGYCGHSLFPVPFGYLWHTDNTTSAMLATYF